MSTEALTPPPPPPVCLTRSYLSRGIKGGTIVAEDVLDLETHLRRLPDPDGYRCCVCPCPRCGSSRVHAHCFRERLLRPSDRRETPRSVTIRLYRCAAPFCGAVFTVLPAFIARHLWRSWETVHEVVSHRTPAPSTTRRRWLSRLASDSSQLVQAFMVLALNGIREVLARRRVGGNRASFIQSVEAFLSGSSSPLGLIAAWIHRLQPGIRLM